MFDSCTQFKAHVLPIETVYTAEDRAVSRHLLGLWTNFAKFGRPTPEEEEQEAAQFGLRWPRFGGETERGAGGGGAEETLWIIFFLSFLPSSLTPDDPQKLHIDTRLTVGGDSGDVKKRCAG